MRIRWYRWATLLSGAALLLQVPACTDAAVIVTSIASVFSAGGVLFLVSRVLE